MTSAASGGDECNDPALRHGVAAMKHTLSTDTLRGAVVEQVMRVTGDDALVLPFLVAPPGSRAAHAALGRLLSEAAVRLVVGCPLMAFVSGTGLDPSWRTSCPPASDSLWSSLEFLEQMYGPAPELPDPYEALEELRARAESDLGTSL